MAEEASRGACARPSGGLSVVLPAGAGLGESESDTEAAAPRAGNGPPDPPPPLGRDPPRRDPSGGPPAAWPWGPAMPRLEEVANVVLRVPSIVLLDLLYRWDVQAFAELLRPKQEEATWRRHALWHAYYLGHVLCVVVLLLPVRSLVRLYLYGLTLLLLFVGHQTARDYMRHEMEDEFQGAVYQDPVVLRRFVTALTGQIFVSMLCALLMKTKQVWLFCAPLLPLLARLCGLPLQALPVVNTFATSVTVVEVLYVATSHLLVPFHLAAAACREVAQGLEVYRLVALGMSLWSQLAVPVLFLVFWLVLFTLQIYSFLASSNSLLAQQGLLFIFLSSVAECCGTPYSLLGLTFTVSYLALAVLNLCKFYLLGYDAFQNGNVMHRGVTEGVTLLLLALQTGLLDLQILQRTFLLSIILFIVVTSTLQSMIEIADPIVLALGASQNRSPWKHFRSLSLCLFLLVFPCFMAYKIARFFHMDFWLLILVSSCMLTSLQVRPGPLLPPPTPSLALPSLQVRPGPLLPPPTPSLALPSLQVRPGPLLPPPTPSLALPSLQVRPGSLLPPPTPSLALPSLQVQPGPPSPLPPPSCTLTSLQVRPGPPSPLPPPSCTLPSLQVRLGPPSPLPPTSCTLTSLQVRPGLPSPLPPPSCTLTSLQVRPGPFLPVPIPSRSLPSLQVMGTLFVYALFMIELLQDAPLEKTDEIIYYVNAVSRVLEFLVAVCVVAYGTWESIFGEWSWMGASVIIIHSYFNVWLRAQSGWKSFLLRREAAKKINSLPRATRGQLRDHNDVCAICFQEMTVAVITDCGHFFHTGCLRKWLYVQDTCPMCHQPVKPSATEGPQSNGGERAEPEPELVPEEGPPEDADAEAAGRTRTLGPSRAAGGREPSWQEQENPALAEPSRAAEGEEPSWQEQENPALAAPSRAGLLPEAVHSREDEPMDPAGSRTPPPMSRGCAP
ncbi:RING finger protein 145-like isoform X38 [Gopherus flavomarginatus]|uniref:RING finger protein 145-like isoform X38 n=1 Tax=Gopherus flavomarginatus TaxID=286002 RepID=UPI0021CC14B6|nr:RING finger protein 145-like isoform X38 [Gopherus flavomarginatus]